MKAIRVRTQPRRPPNGYAVEESLLAAPVEENLNAPTPSGLDAAFKPSDSGFSMAAQLAAYLGRNDIATIEVAKTSAFTKDDLERKNQEREAAWVTGPTIPFGAGSGGGLGATTLQPFVNAPANRERLNAGTPVRPELGAPYLRGLGNAWGGGVAYAANWASLAHVLTDQATVDLDGFAQVNHTGNLIRGVENEFNLARGNLDGGPLSNAANYGGVNAGAVFSAQDGAAGGDVGFALVNAGAGNDAFAYEPPSGEGALEVSKPYGIAALIASYRR